MAARKRKPTTGPGSRTGDNARSGPNVTNDQRHTAQVLLRLPPDVADELRALGAEHEGGISGWVAARVRTALARKA